MTTTVDSEAKWCAILFSQATPVAQYGNYYSFTASYEERRESAAAGALLTAALGELGVEASLRRHGNKQTLTIEGDTIPLHSVNQQIDKIMQGLETNWEKDEKGGYRNTRSFSNDRLDSNLFRDAGFAASELLCRIKNEEGAPLTITSSEWEALQKKAGTRGDAKMMERLHDAPVVGVRLTVDELGEASSLFGFSNPAEEKPHTTVIAEARSMAKQLSQARLEGEMLRISSEGRERALLGASTALLANALKACGSSIYWVQETHGEITLLVGDKNEVFPLHQVNAQLDKIQKSLETGWEKTGGGEYRNTKAFHEVGREMLNPRIMKLAGVKDVVLLYDVQGELVTSTIMDQELHRLSPVGVQLNSRQLAEASARIGFKNPAQGMSK